MAITSPTILDGFEHGVTGSGITSGAGICNAQAGTWTITTSNPNGAGSFGARALQINPTAATGYIRWSFSNLALIVGRIYIRFNGSLPGANVTFATFSQNTNADTTFRFNSASSKIELLASGNVDTPSTTVSANTWYRIDFKFDLSANPNVYSWQINGTAQTGKSVSQAADTFWQHSLGTTASATCDISFDDYALTTTSGDYPIGESYIVGLSPSGAGTHSYSGTPFSWTTNSGSNWTNVTTTTEDQSGKLNAVPINGTTNRIRQTATGTSAYLEHQWANLPAGASSVQAARGFVAYMAAGTAANQGASGAYRSSDSTFLEIFGNPTTRADMSESSAFVKSANLALNGTTTSEVNGLTHRIGYSNDVTPNPHWLGAMLQVAVVGSTDQTIVNNHLGPTATLYQPAVAPGSVTVDANHLGPTGTLYQPAVVQQVGANHLGPTAALYQPAVSQVITANHLGPTATLYQPSATQFVEANHIGPTATVYSPDVAQAFSTNHLGPTATLYQPAVVPGSVTVVANHLGPTATLNQPAATYRVQMAGQARLIIPLYVYPSFFGSDWDTVQANPCQFIIANPATGPGTSQNSDYLREIQEARTAGVKVLGYVNTMDVGGGGDVRLLADVTGEVDDWYTWYPIDGIFFDLVPTGALGDRTQFCSDIASHVTSNYGSHMVTVANPGTWPLAGAYLDPFTVTCVWEGHIDTNGYLSSSVPGYASSYAGNYPPHRLLHLVYGVTDATEAQTAFEYAWGQGAGWFYATDQSTGVWSSLSSFYTDELTFNTPGSIIQRATVHAPAVVQQVATNHLGPTSTVHQPGVAQVISGIGGNLFTSDWAGPNSSSWPAPWSTGASGATVDVQSNRGRIALAGSAGGGAEAGHGVVASLLTGSGDYDLTVDVDFSNVGVETYAFAYAGDSHWYGGVPNNGVGIQIAPIWSKVSIERRDSTAGTNLADVTWPGTPAANTAYRIRLRREGSTVSCKAWAVGDTEPSTWGNSATESAYRGPSYGTLMLGFVVGASATSTEVRFDNLQIHEPANHLGPTATVYSPSVAAQVVANHLGPTSSLYQPAVVGEATVAPDTLGPTATLYQPTVTPGSVTVAANHLGPTSTFYEPAVVPGAVTVGANHLGPTATLYEPAVTPGAVTVALDVLGPTAALYQPAVTPGAVTVEVNHLGPTGTLHQPAVVQGEVTVAPDALGPISSLYQPAVTPGPVSVVLPALTSGSLYAPAVSQLVEPATLGPTATLHQPAVVPGSVTISGNHLGPTATLYQPAVTPGAVTVEASHIGPTSTVHQPAVTPGAVTVATNHLGPTATLNLHDVSVTLTAGHIGPTALVYTPAVTPGAVTVAANHISSTATVFQPSATYVVEPPHLSGTTFYSPTVTTGPVSVAPSALGPTATVFEQVVSDGGVVVVPHLGPTATAYTPAVTPGAVTVAPDTLGPTAALHQPAVTSETVLVAPASLGPTSAAHQPAVAYLVAPGSLTSGGVHAPAVTPGAVTVAPVALGPVAALYAPAVETTTTVALPLIGPTATVHPPTITPGAVTIVVPPIIAGTLYAPGVEIVVVPVPTNMEAGTLLVAFEPGAAALQWELGAVAASWEAGDLAEQWEAGSLMLSEQVGTLVAGGP